MFGDWQEIREEDLEATEQPRESIQLAKEILNENYQINQTEIENKTKAAEQYPEAMNQARMHAAGYQQEISNIDLSQPEDYIPKITFGLELEPEQEDQLLQNAMKLAEFKAKPEVKFSNYQPTPKTEAASLTYIAAQETNGQQVTKEQVANTIHGAEERQIRRYNSIIQGNRYPNFLQKGEKRIDNKNLQKQLQEP